MNPLEQLVLEYIQYTSSILNNPQLGDNVKPQMLQQMAQSLNVLVPLVQNPDQANQQLAVEKHQQDLQMTQEKHALELQKAQEKHQLDLAIAQQKAAQQKANQAKSKN